MTEKLEWTLDQKQIESIIRSWVCQSHGFSLEEVDVEVTMLRDERVAITVTPKK
jgi:hypothetical protein